jgi:hypothetical protein
MRAHGQLRSHKDIAGVLLTVALSAPAAPASGAITAITETNEQLTDGSEK